MKNSTRKKEEMSEEQNGQNGDWEENSGDSCQDQEPDQAQAETTGNMALKEAQAKIAALQNELDAAKDMSLRALAEADNIRKRAIRERDDAKKYAVAGFARDLLGVADSFRRAIESIPEDLRNGNEQLANLVTGIEAVEKNMSGVFERHGIHRLEPMDEPFNPNFHEVMFEAPVPGKPSGMIIQLIEPGYLLHDRLLRPARVGVAKGDDSTSNEPGSKIDTQA